VTETPSLLMTALSFLLVLGPLIFVHEMGHYLAGRWFGVHAEAFSIGFGREIFGWSDKRGTRWKVGWMPLGGYVKFAGDMNPASVPSPEWLSLPPEERSRTFQAKPLWQRFIIVAAGPITNFLFAILVFAGFFWAYGEPRTPPIVARVAPASAAEGAGLKPGDRILRIAGKTVERFEDVGLTARIRPGERVALEVERGGERFRTTARLDVDVQQDRFGNVFRMGRLGIASPPPVVEPLGPHQLLGASVRHTAEVVGMIIDTTVQVITGRRSLQELGGPLKIAQYSGQQATIGWMNFVQFMAMISINLGFINLLPIPLLDGGHLLFYTIEGIRRRPLRPVVQEWAFRTGLALLLTLMVFVTVNDLGSFGLWDRLAGLIG
jgi:regulator of sigma E protease